MQHVDTRQSPPKEETQGTDPPQRASTKRTQAPFQFTNTLFRFVDSPCSFLFFKVGNILIGEGCHCIVVLLFYSLSSFTVVR